MENETIELDSKTLAVFKRKKYHILNKLGAGAFGVVYKCERTNSKPASFAAVKVMFLGKMNSTMRTKFLPRELQAMMETQHENIVETFDIIRANQNMFIFMEFMGGGDVAGYMKKNDGVKPRLACIWFFQILSGLVHLHKRIFMSHRDIKLDNMLLNNHRVAKLSDFGFARISYDPDRSKVIMSETFCGTLPYYSPQLVFKKPYNPFKADVWAMGVSLFVMFENRFPFHFKDRGEMLKEQKRYPNYLQSRFQSTPPEGQSLIEKMLNPDEHNRFSATDVFQNQWLQKFGKKSIE